MSHRWMKFWPGDWQGDASLRMCGLAARGLWIECIAIMHEAEPYGHLLVNGRALTTRQLAAVVGGSERDVVKLLAELEDAGVFSRTDAGTIYSRRMVRDASKAQEGREAVTKRWANKGDAPSPTRQPNTPPNRPPSSLDTEADTEAEKTPPTPRRRGAVVAVSLPPWLPPDAWDEWCRHRVGMKKAGWTNGAAVRCIADLAKFRDAGDDPRAVIDQSIAGGWTGLFPLKRQATRQAGTESKIAWMSDFIGTPQPSPRQSFDLDLTAEEAAP